MLERLILPADLVVTPVAELTADIRKELEAESGDVVLTRPRHRRRSIVVDMETARLLEIFREPTTVPEAVLLHSVRIGTDAEQLLANCYPVLRRLTDGKFLVRVQDAALSAAFPYLAPGTMLGPWRIERSLQVFDDSDVYRASGPDGLAAIKVARPTAGARLRRLLARERDVLQILKDRGFRAPRVINDSGLDDDAETTWLALTWIPGRRADDVAGQLRRRFGPASPEAFRLCAEIVFSYASLQSHGVLHGDVHPGNLLVEETDSTPVVTLIDFSLASLVDGSGPGLLRERGGIGWAFEPELAASAVAGNGDVPVTAAGEQYSLATMCFHLLTGRNHLDLPWDRRAMFAQILQGDVHRLSEVINAGNVSIGEQALLRAMSLAPQDRYPDLSEFAAALSGQADALGTRSYYGEASRLRTFVENLSSPPGVVDFVHVSAPRSTVCYGAAGTALGLLRIAQLRQDPALLDAAERWSLLAALPQPEGEARYNRRFQITPDTVTNESLYHSLSGIRCSEALLAQATGDEQRAASAAQAFLGLIDPASPGTELINGEGGRVIGAALLLAALRTPGVRRTHDDVDSWLRTAVPALARRLSRESADNPALGLAHGAAGGILAVLLGERALGTRATPLSRQLTEWLTDQVARRPVDSWPIMAGLHHSWCNGSAGVALTLAIAGRHTGNAAATEAAVVLGTHAARYRGRNWTLCCGSSGVGLALLSLAKATLDPRWLQPAREMLSLATSTAQLGEPHAHSLHKGALAVAVLAAELEYPERAAFPGLIAEAIWS